MPGTPFYYGSHSPRERRPNSGFKIYGNMFKEVHPPSEISDVLNKIAIVGVGSISAHDAVRVMNTPFASGPTTITEKKEFSNPNEASYFRVSGEVDRDLLEAIIQFPSKDDGIVGFLKLIQTQSSEDEFKQGFDKLVSKMKFDMKCTYWVFMYNMEERHPKMYRSLISLGFPKALYQ